MKSLVILLLAASLGPVVVAPLALAPARAQVIVKPPPPPPPPPPPNSSIVTPTLSPSTLPPAPVIKPGQTLPNPRILEAETRKPQPERPQVATPRKAR